MPHVYRSPVKETSRKTPLESPHPHLPYQPLHAIEAAAQDAAHGAAAEEARHTVAEEADTPGDTHIHHDTDNPAEIQAASDTPAPHTPAHAGIVAGPQSGMDSSVTSIPLQHHQ